MLYHVVERPQFKVPYVTGPEYQLIDEPNFSEKLEDWQKMGVDYAMHLPDTRVMKVNPAGKWNNSKIVFDNGHVEHWLNGVKILEFEAWTDDWFARRNSGKWSHAPEYGLSRKGLICLQDHGYPASFRNIKLKELPRKSEEVVLFNGQNIEGWQAYGTELWYVKDGLLVCESGSDKKYGYLLRINIIMILISRWNLSRKPMAIRGSLSGLLSMRRLRWKDGRWRLLLKVMIREYIRILWSWMACPDTNEKEDILKESAWNLMRIRVQGDNVTTGLTGRKW